jgi:dihydrofolate reductase
MKSLPRISLIVAIAQNGAIGQAGNLPWKIPEDMRYFKETTLNHVVIMGHKTFLSMNSRLLPNRTNIILTHQAIKIPGAIVCHSMEDSLAAAREIEEKEIFVIGGGNIFQQFMPLAERIYLTKVFKDYPEADTFFPDYSQFNQVISQRPSHDDNYKYEFVVLERA